jgi:hypothetical protein
LYMDRLHGHLRGYDDAHRLLFRSTHIYLLLAAVANTLVGLHLTRSPAGWRRGCQLAGSLAILATPALFLAAFCTEPWLSGMARPWTQLGAFMALGGVIFEAISAVGSGRVT